MRLNECRVGQGVVYRPTPDVAAEDGVITEVRPPWVMVRYAGDQHAKATRPEDLDPLLRDRAGRTVQDHDGGRFDR